jgi:hypothetical protein
MAAVLGCGPGAALSHRSAAELWGLLAPRPQVHVTAPVRGGRRRQRGIHLHRSPSLPSATTWRKGIAVTTPARTITDLRRILEPAEVDEAIAQAEVMRLPIGHHPGSLQEPTRSELERAFLRLCRRNALPKPEVNVRLGRIQTGFPVA